jgi:hypothetical protein
MEFLMEYRPIASLYLNITQTPTNITYLERDSNLSWEKPERL